MRRRLAQIGIGVLVVGMVSMIVATVVFVLYPRDIMTWYTRFSLERAGFEQQSVDHDHGHISYFEAGDGPPLVFVHGLADQGGSWYDIASEFTDDYTVVVPDLPGHGDSPYTNGEVMSEESLQPLFELFDEKFDEDPAAFVGNSLGGWVTFLYALESPDNVDRLVPVGSGGLEHEIEPTLLMPEDREDARRTVRAIFGDDPPPTPGFVLDRIVERSEHSVVADAFDRADDAEYLDDELPHLQVPTELVWGSEDLVFPLDYAEQMDDTLPRSRLHVIDGCGHSPQVGCPDEFAELLDELLAGEPPVE